MDDPRGEQGLPEIWICPQCGARLVSRNLWHSCGQFSLESLFGNADQRVLDLAHRFVALLHTLGDVQVIPQKTRLVCVARVRFSGLVPRKDGFLVSFALHRRLDLDDELISWLQESHDVVGLQSDLRRAKQ